MTNPMIPVIIMVVNIIPPIEPINSKANGRIRVNTPVIIRKEPTAFANLLLSPLKVCSIKNLSFNYKFEMNKNDCSKKY